MTYDINQLGQLTLDELKQVAKDFGLKVKRNAEAQGLIYEILDAQAIQHAAEVEAKADARTTRKRERTRVAQKQEKVEKVGLAHLKDKGPKMTSQAEEQKAMAEQVEQRTEEQARLQARRRGRPRKVLFAEEPVAPQAPHPVATLPEPQPAPAPVAETVIIEEEAVPMAELPAEEPASTVLGETRVILQEVADVLGAERLIGEGRVLGARRTADIQSTELAIYAIILLAAAAGFIATLTAMMIRKLHRVSRNRSI